MALVLPLMAFLIGFFATQWFMPYKSLMSATLARVLIPGVIIYNMVFYQTGSIWLIVFSLISATLLYVIFLGLKAGKVIALGNSYLNAAWLGFPLALTLFGPAATASIVALYIGGSIFGNVCAVLALSQQQQAWQPIVAKVLLSPPVMALSCAAILSFWDWTVYENSAWLNVLYSTNKMLVTFVGMCILGMWLSQVRIQVTDLIESLKWLALRACFAILLCVMAYFVFPIAHERLIFAVMMMYFLLPPAANIVALETYYRGTGESAKIIAAGTVISTLVIVLYGLSLHVLQWI